MYNWWIRPIHRGAVALVCLRVFAVAARNPSVHGAGTAHARVGDGLAGMFAELAREGDERTAHGGLPVNIFCGLSASASLRATMALRKGANEILQDGKDSRQGRDGPGIATSRWGGTAMP